MTLPRSCRWGRGVGQDDDGCLQAFGTVHRHHPHLVAGDLHVAFDVGPGCAQPGDEALQRRCFAAFIVERAIEKFVERVVGLVTEARKKALATSLGPQYACIEPEWRLLVRPLRKAIEPLDRRREAWVHGRLRPQCRVQRCLALPGDLEQVLVVQPEQRRLEHGGQGEVVGRQQQRIREHHQIHDRDMLGQHQPIGAGHRHMGILERADDRLEHGATLAHQYQHVTGARALLRPTLDVCRDLRRQPDLRALFRQLVERRIPGLDLALLLRLDGVPDLDEARHRFRQPFVHGPYIVGRQPAVRLRPFEYLVDGAEQIGS